MKFICPTCEKEREISKAMIRLIDRGINSGDCVSCSRKKRERKVGYDKDIYATRLYKIWSNMKTRCTNKNTKYYKNYGGRGITYAKEWETFSGFLDNLPEGYSDKLTLDRIDNNSGYSKENCRWSDKKVQSNNRRTNRFVTIDGVTKTFAQWCNDSNIKPSTIRNRFYVLGWSLKDSLSINI